MHPFRQLSLIEQIADHLRLGFRNGHWCGQLPGMRELARELGVSKASVEAALHLLEDEGSLESRGAARRKEVVAERQAEGKSRVLRVGIILSQPLNLININSQRLILDVVRRIEHAGHTCFIAERSMSELGYKLPRLVKMCETAKADAWIAYAAPRDALEWFVHSSTPVLAVGGGYAGLPLAATSSSIDEAIRDSVSALSGLGHRRIVVISPDSWRIPAPSQAAKGFLTAMEECGHQPTKYNLPAWEATPAGLARLLESLFQVTPPTALICVDPSTYVAAYGFLGLKGLRVPQDVSIVSMTSGEVFSLVPRSPAHFNWPLDQHVSRIARWVKCLAKGGTDLNHTTFAATFVPGETLARARSRFPAGW